MTYRQQSYYHGGGGHGHHQHHNPRPRPRPGHSYNYGAPFFSGVLGGLALGSLIGPGGYPYPPYYGAPYYPPYYGYPYFY